MPGPDGIIIAIDGPAGSGKSSTARALAAELGYRHLDSGAFYRAVTLAALRAGIPEERWHDLTVGELDALQVRGIPERPGAGEHLPSGRYRMMIGDERVDEEIRAPEVNANVSRMAAVPAVRDWLMDALRAAGRSGGLVADGRDIGTVVFPEADLKVFLVAAPEARARRRLAERGIHDPDLPALRDEARRLVERDRRDSQREAAPLLRAPDAVLIDTSALTFDRQVRAILRLARHRIEHGPAL